MLYLRATLQPVLSTEDSVMKQCISLALLGVLVIPATAHAQNKFVYDAQLTQEGVKDLQKRSAVGLRTAIIKAAEAVGCKQEYWYFEPLVSVGHGGVDCPTATAPVALVTAVNAAGFARVRWRVVLTAEQMDELLGKGSNVRAPQNLN
jgi:hypothetical protein